MERTGRPGKSNGGSPALCIFMVLCALAVALLGYQVGNLAAQVQPPSFAPVRPAMERSA